MSGNNKSEREKLLKKVKHLYKRLWFTFITANTNKCFKLLKQLDVVLNKISSGTIPDDLIFFYGLSLYVKSSIYAYIGLLNRSFEYANSLLTFGKEKDDNQCISFAYHCIARYYCLTGNFKIALENLNLSIELIENMSPVLDYMFFAELLSLLHSALRITLKIGDSKQANFYLKKVKEINDRTQNKFTDSFYLLCRALMLKSSIRSRNRVMAEEYLKEIINNRIFFSAKHRMDAINDLCELLLVELQLTNEKSVINEIKPYLTKLINLSQKTNSYFYLIEAYILQGKIALLTFDMTGARRFFTQAQRIADRCGYFQMATEVGDLHENFLQQKEIWDALKESNAPISKRMELAQLGKHFDDMIQIRKKEATQKTVSEITVFKEKKMCLVCKGNIEGFNNFICPTCDSIYCEKCAKTLIDYENVCWVCNTPFDKSKPSTPFKELDEDIAIEEKNLDKRKK